MPANFWYESKPIFVDINSYSIAFDPKSNEYEESSDSSKGDCSGSDLDQDRENDDEFFNKVDRRL